jgi:hypothetical protein
MNTFMRAAPYVLSAVAAWLAGALIAFALAGELPFSHF